MKDKTKLDYAVTLWVFFMVCFVLKLMYCDIKGFHLQDGYLVF